MGGERDCLVGYGPSHYCHCQQISGGVSQLCSCRDKWLCIGTSLNDFCVARHGGWDIPVRQTDHTWGVQLPYASVGVRGEEGSRCDEIAIVAAILSRGVRCTLVVRCTLHRHTGPFHICRPSTNFFHLPFWGFSLTLVGRYG